MNNHHDDYSTPVHDDYRYSRRDEHGPLSPPSTPRPTKKQRILRVTPLLLEDYLMLPDLDETSHQSQIKGMRNANDLEFRLKLRTVSPPIPFSRPGAKEETATTTSIKRPGQIHCPRRTSLAHRTSKSSRSTKLHCVLYRDLEGRL
jgi:hypothetical protein